MFQGIIGFGFRRGLVSLSYGGFGFFLSCLLNLCGDFNMLLFCGSILQYVCIYRGLEDKNVVWDPGLFVLRIHYHARSKVRDILSIIFMLGHYQKLMAVIELMMSLEVRVYFH